MAFRKRSLHGAEALMLLLLLMLSTRVNVRGSQLIHDISKDTLQPNASNADQIVHTRQKHCASGRCLKQRRTEQDEQFLNYITNFATSSHGLLLDDIIRSQLVQPAEAVDTATLDKTPVTKNSLIEIEKLLYDYSWDIANAIVLLFSSGCFIYIVVCGPLSNYCISTISAHVICSLFLGLTHDIIPLWLLMALSFGAEAVLCVFLQYLDNVKRRQICVFFTCMVKAQLLYDLFAVLPFDAISPSYTGIAGVIATHVLRTSNFMVVRLLYTVVLFAISTSFFRNLPAYVTSEPSELDDVELAANVMKKMVCFVAAWPVGALVPQALCTLNKTTNPIGPYTFFFTPTQFRLDALESWAALLSWGVVAVALFNYTKHKGDPAVRSTFRETKWWRASPRGDPEY